MLKTIRKRRCGFTLLELVVTTSLVGITVSSIAILLRSSVATWDAYESDRSRLDDAHGVVRHFVRGLRQASAVTAISASTVTTGTITVTTVDGLTANWSLSGSSLQYTVNGVNEQIASNVTAFTFVGRKADGTEATVPSDIRSVQIAVTVQLDRDANNSRTIRSSAWLRVKE